MITGTKIADPKVLKTLLRASIKVVRSMINPPEKGND
jgi:hypothetical protein